MEKNIKLEGMRCSAFYRPLMLSIKVLSSFMDEKTDASPFRVEHTIIASNSKSECLLVSTDQKIRINVTNDRVDGIITLGEEEEKGIKETMDVCAKYVKRMLKLMEVNATRLAIVPAYKYVGDQPSYARFFKRIFNEKFTSFENTAALPSEITQLFCVEENINGVPTVLNYFSRFYTLERGTAKGINMMEFDINTVLNRKYSFDGSAVEAFFSKGPSFCQKYIKHFFEDL